MLLLSKKTRNNAIRFGARLSVMSITRRVTIPANAQEKKSIN